MELYDVMRTTFAVREFTVDPLPDDILYRILDNARFSPSGGNRQAGHIIVVRDATIRQQLAELAVPGARRYVAQIQAGENPWNPLRPCTVAPAVVEDTEVPDTFTAPFLRAALVLVVSVDLSYVAAMDQDLDRIGVVSGASVYPLVWNILLAPATRATAAPSPPWPSPRSLSSDHFWPSPTRTPWPLLCRLANRQAS